MDALSRALLMTMSTRPFGAMSRSSLRREHWSNALGRQGRPIHVTLPSARRRLRSLRMHFIKLNLQLDTKQFLLHVLLVQAASPPPVQAASPSIPLLSLLDLAPLLSGPNRRFQTQRNRR